MVLKASCFAKFMYSIHTMILYSTSIYLYQGFISCLIEFSNNYTENIHIYNMYILLMIWSICGLISLCINTFYDIYSFYYYGVPYWISYYYMTGEIFNKHLVNFSYQTKKILLHHIIRYILGVSQFISFLIWSIILMINIINPIDIYEIKNFDNMKYWVNQGIIIIFCGIVMNFLIILYYAIKMGFWRN
jgi:hypothetical protein